MKNFITAVLFTVLTVVAVAQNSEKEKAMDYLNTMGEVCFKIETDNPANTLSEIGSIVSIDRYNDASVNAYANKEQFDNFLKTGLQFSVITPASMLHVPKMTDKNNLRDIYDWDSYPTYEAYVSLMQQFAADYPYLCEVVSIDTLTSGREILFIHINNDLTQEQNEPEFMYTSSIHGNELTGYVLMLRYIDYLLSNYATSDRIKNLVDKIDIWINPLANPDGAYQGGNGSVYGATRFNAFGVDLNRNYADPDDGQHPDGKVYQSETKAFMNFAKAHNFVMSANLHGGSEVVNYPWDTWQKLTADNDWWYFVSREYADTVHEYAPENYLTELNDGITNGYQWYTITGGRQDYMNYFHYCREVTIELSFSKVPMASLLPGFWEYNYRSFLNFMEQSLYGVSGVIKDAKTNEPVAAKVYIEGYDKDNSFVYSSLPVGDYHRLLKAGDYSVTYSAEGYKSKTISVSVADRQATIKDVFLEPIVGLEELTEQTVEVFPIPVSDRLMVRSNKAINTLEVIDVSGRVVVCFSNIFDAELTIDMHTFQPGVYFVKTGFVTKKVIKK
jgi:hypothetical protein